MPYSYINLGKGLSCLYPGKFLLQLDKALEVWKNLSEAQSLIGLLLSAYSTLC